MKILLSGLRGHMGAELVRLAKEGYRGAELIGGVDRSADGSESVPCVRTFDAAETAVDCVVDFSHHSNTHALVRFAEAHGLPLIIATTGQDEAELAEIRAAAERIPVFFSANMSLGVALLVELAKQTAAAMPDAEIEIIEKHHDRKLDAPSGTALMLARAIAQVRASAFSVTGRRGHGRRTPEEIGIHSVRLGDLVGSHEVLVGTRTETITLRHEAHSRALFAEGALAAAEFLCRQGPGLYDMTSLVSFA